MHSFITLKLRVYQIIFYFLKLLNLRKYSDQCLEYQATQKKLHWKATEFRSFLVYYGAVCLKNHLPDNMYRHFLLLHVTISILLSSELCLDNEWLDYSEKLLVMFVSQFPEFYGRGLVSFNIHSLRHIVDDVRYRKCSLDNFSAFPFESFYYTLKKLVRSTNNALQQVLRRFGEIQDIVLPPCSLPSTSPVLLAQKKDLLEIDNKLYKEFSKYVVPTRYEINTGCKGDQCVQLKDGSIVQIDNLFYDKQRDLLKIS